MSANPGETAYLDLLRTILATGDRKMDRTGTGTVGIFGPQLRFDLNAGFPLLTTKKLNWKAVVVELLWFIRGDTNIRFLLDHGVHIWNEWSPAYKRGGKVEVQRVYEATKGDVNPPRDLDLGPVYGQQFRDFGRRSYHFDGGDRAFGGVLPGVDQLADVIQRIKDKPNDRRLIVSAWNPLDIPAMALPPCHCLFQFYVADGKLSCQLYQRSADMFLGVPFNIASYALLTHMVAIVCGLKVGTFVHTFGDAHIYNNHWEQAQLQCLREPKRFPIISLRSGVQSIEEFGIGDVALIGYDPHPAIKGEVSV